MTIADVRQVDVVGLGKSKKVFGTTDRRLNKVVLPIAIADLELDGSKTRVANLSKEPEPVLRDDIILPRLRGPSLPTLRGVLPDFSTCETAQSIGVLIEVVQGEHQISVSPRYPFL